MTTKHLPIGGSTATRTLACPGWVQASANVPKGKSSVYADEGNLLHDAMENFYKNDEEFAAQVNRELTYNGQLLTQDLVDDYLIPAYDMVESVLDHYDVDEFVCEPFVEYIPDLAGGSIDMLAKSTCGKYVIILDYKFGHAAVSPESAQLPFYALSAQTDGKTSDFFKKAERLVYVIIQPKVSHEPQYLEVDYSTLQAFKNNLDDAIALSQQANSPKEPGKHCQYCPSAPYCDEKKAQVKSALLIPPNDAEKLAESLDLISELDAWIKDVEKAAHDLMESGAKIPRYKLVAKRATRKWKNAAQATEFFLQREIDAFDTKLKTPTQMEKLVKKLDINIDQLIVKESSGTTVVHETDKREAVVIPDIADSLHRIVNDGKQQ